MEQQLYSYWPIIARPQLRLPHNARLAFWIGLNLEHYELDKPATSLFPASATLVPDPLNYGWRDYGLRVGLWRMMEAFDRYGVRASVLLNADVCQFYPQVIEEGNKRGWAWLAHGKNNSILQANMDEDAERGYLKQVVETITTHTGQQPRGWLGPALTETLNTPRILAELGVSYICDWCNDDQPYPMQVDGGRMISVPYSIELNDIPLFVGKSLSGQDFYQMVVDQFDVLYQEGASSGRVMCLALHPFIIGLPFRFKYLEKALRYITSHKDVWLATSDEIAGWYYENYYEQALAQARQRSGIA
ncbi:MAG TPA: polysaccharide deacetylase family protein [Dehalococcoidia bacterium]|nr:polysaccharide deacetylase family protein [Dehalococcoidia bacterium]